jgi:superkiller protein 3
MCAADTNGAEDLVLDVHYQMGNEYNKSDLIDLGITEYKKAIEINGYSAKVYNNLGVAYSKRKMFDEEIVAYKMAIDLIKCMKMHILIWESHIQREWWMKKSDDQKSLSWIRVLKVYNPGHAYRGKECT